MAIGDGDDDDQDDKLLEMLLNDSAPSINHDENRKGIRHKSAADTADDKVKYMIKRMTFIYTLNVLFFGLGLRCTVVQW